MGGGPVGRAHEPTIARGVAGRSCRSRRSLLPLAWFKYYGFFALNLANAFESLGLHPPLPLLQVLLPIGISFYTFMAISYVVDVSRYEIQVSGWLDVSVYLAFFPHLIAGPIVRGEELIPQIRRPRDPRRIDVSRASFLIVGGLFKKMVISSFLASQIVDPVFGAPNAHGGHRGPGRDLRVRDRDLRRLQRVQRHRDRRRAAARVRVPGELRPAVHGGLAAGLLAPVAHDAVAMVARLPLHPARRQPPRRGPHRRQHHDHDAARRAVARGRVDVRRVGRVPRDRPGDRAMADARVLTRSGSSSGPPSGSWPASSW